MRSAGVLFNYAKLISLLEGGSLIHCFRINSHLAYLIITWSA